MCVAPAMDCEILHNLFRDFLEASDILKIENDLTEKVREMQTKIPPLRIGKNGQLMEWMEDYEEAEPGHRHISHLFGVFPGHASDPPTITGISPISAIFWQSSSNSFQVVGASVIPASSKMSFLYIKNSQYSACGNKYRFPSSASVRKSRIAPFNLSAYPFLYSSAPTSTRASTSLQAADSAPFGHPKISGSVSLLMYICSFVK